jgi:hypothetical protein
MSYRKTSLILPGVLVVVIVVLLRKAKEMAKSRAATTAALELEVTLGDGLDQDDY